MNLRKQSFYRVSFYVTITPGADPQELMKPLSNAIADEINEEFPEIGYVSSVKFKKKKVRGR